MIVMCIVAFHVVAQVGGERKSHFTAQGYMSMCFSQKKHVWSEYLSCNMGGGAALSWTQRFPNSGVFFDYQLSFGVWDCETKSDAIEYEARLLAPRSGNGGEFRFVDVNLRPAVSIGYNWLIGEKMGLDIYAGLEYQFSFGKTAGISGQFNALSAKAGINFHLNKRWLINAEFAPSLTRISSLEAHMQRLQVGAGFKF